MVVIESEGTPDWVPERGPSQADIDRVVEDLLRTGPDARQ
jgi:hypothetical protein